MFDRNTIGEKSKSFAEKSYLRIEVAGDVRENKTHCLIILQMEIFLLLFEYQVGRVNQTCANNRNDDTNAGVPTRKIGKVSI